MVVCFPWANIEAITEKVGKIVGPGKGGSILVEVGTSNAERERTPAVVRKYRQFIRTLKSTRAGDTVRDFTSNRKEGSDMSTLLGDGN